MMSELFVQDSPLFRRLFHRATLEMLSAIKFDLYAVIDGVML